MTTATTTAAELEAHVAELDQRRRELATELFACNRSAGATGSPDPAGHRRTLDLTREAVELDGERHAAHKQLRQARERETRRRGWEAAVPVLGEHRDVCKLIAALASELVSALDAERELHAMLHREAGASVLQDLNHCSDAKLIERLHLLAETAKIIATAQPSPPARESEQPTEVVA